MLIDLSADAGFRHDSLHEPPAAGPPATPAPPTAPAPAPEPSGLLPKGMARITSCPQDLAALSAPALINPEYSHRNHKQFLDLYDLGPVLGTGGYAVVRECTRKATGERFAAKMMTVSEHPESGGREIDRQVRPRGTPHWHPCLGWRAGLRWRQSSM